ncbi:hypothetical protein A6033_17490 [Aeromonas veronii]|nr:hypothetical protein A6033_17490 [Aeromonas veronii]PSJ92034.1 hypothetical protein CT153_03135 [Aeromonas veronii]
MPFLYSVFLLHLYQYIGFLYTTEICFFMAYLIVKMLFLGNMIYFLFSGELQLAGLVDILFFSYLIL